MITLREEFQKVDIRRKKILPPFRTIEKAMESMGAKKCGGPRGVHGIAKDESFVVLTMWPDQMTIENGKYVYDTRYLVDGIKSPHAKWRRANAVKMRSDLLAKNRPVRIVLQEINCNELVPEELREKSENFYPFSNAMFNCTYSCADGDFKGDYRLEQIVE